MSSRLLIVSDPYGRVKKKSKAANDMSAATAPPIRPPSTAAITTTTTRTSDPFDVRISSRAGISAKATTTGPASATTQARGKTGWETRRRRSESVSMAALYARIQPGNRALMRS